MPDIAISEFMDRDAVAELEREFEVLYDPGLVDDGGRLIDAVAQVPALIVRNRTQVRGDLLASAKSLKVVGRLGVGLDNIDTEACEQRGIEVIPARGANDLSVAEYVITSALMLLRRANFAKNAMLEGEWPRQALMGAELSGKTLGLFGFGSIAREVASRGRALGAEIMAHDPFVPDSDPAWRQVVNCPLDRLLGESDIVSLHVPLTPSTRHLIDRQTIAKMRSHAILINASRGGTLDEAALANALHEQKIAGAALDVFETEPLTAEAADKFRGIDNLILTPHIAGVTIESNQRVSSLIAAKVAQSLRAGKR